MNPPPSANLIIFADLVSCFCDWCENKSTDENRERDASAWLCKLHDAASSLPQVSSDYDDDFPELPATLIAKVKNNLAYFNGMYYREFFDPDPNLTDTECMGDVGDDLMDVYLDLKRGSLYFEQGRVGEAQWHWVFLHRIHWGRHAVGAIFALHCLVISKQRLS